MIKLLVYSKKEKLELVIQKIKMENLNLEMANLTFNPDLIDLRTKKLVRYLKQVLCILPNRVISLDTSKYG